MKKQNFTSQRVDTIYPLKRDMVAEWSESGTYRLQHLSPLKLNSHSGQILVPENLSVHLLKVSGFLWAFWLPPLSMN